MDYRSENKKDIADSGIKLLNKKLPKNWRVYIMFKIKNISICNTLV